MIISDQSEADHGWFLLHCLIITPASQTGASLIRNCQTNDDDDRDCDDDRDDGDGDQHEQLNFQYNIHLEDIHFFLKAWYLQIITS